VAERDAALAQPLARRNVTKGRVMTDSTELRVVRRMYASPTARQDRSAM
jgi:hypothetical protein